MTPAQHVAAGERGSRVALAGFVFAVLFAIGWLLLRSSPPIDASDPVVFEFSESASGRRSSLIAGLYAIPFSAIAFMWFAAALRERVVRGAGREHTMLATVYLMATAVFVTALFMVAAIELALVWRIESGAVDVAGTRATIAIGTAVSQLIALRAGAVFVAVSTTRAMRSGLFPRWYAMVSYAIAAALLLVATAWNPVLLSFPLWVVVTSVLVMTRRNDRGEMAEA